MNRITELKSAACQVLQLGILNVGFFLISLYVVTSYECMYVDKSGLTSPSFGYI